MNFVKIYMYSKLLLHHIECLDIKYLLRAQGREDLAREKEIGQLHYNLIKYDPFYKERCILIGILDDYFCSYDTMPNSIICRLTLI